MISIKLQGGLGNQLFMMAAVIAHSLKHELEYYIPLEVDNPHYKDQRPYIFPGVKYSKDIPLLPIYKEPNFHYAEIPPIDNVCFDGYFQSYKYFDDYRDEILEAFGFKWKRKRNYCSVHIRLGDYLEKLDCHPPVTKGYLFEAMMNIMTRVENWEDIKFLVFSDSMDLAKEMLSSREFASFPIEYSEGKNEIEDLELASSCEYNIGSNSAWSLWAYYLNKNQNKIGVFPYNWFGPALPNDTKDLIPTECIRL